MNKSLEFDPALRTTRNIETIINRICQVYALAPGGYDLCTDIPRFADCTNAQVIERVCYQFVQNQALANTHRNNESLEATVHALRILLLDSMTPSARRLLA